MTDLSYLESLAEEDQNLVSGLVDLFAAQAPEFCDEIKALLEQRRAEEAKRTAHTFKGVCLNLGLNELAELCKRLEDTALAGQFEDSLTLLQRLKRQLQETVPAMRTLTQQSGTG
jgi:HPt (histidine-containing phosphotransfer) domain-containing protein